MFSKKATKKSQNLLCRFDVYLVSIKLTAKILLFFVAFFENINFIKGYCSEVAQDLKTVSFTFSLFQSEKRFWQTMLAIYCFHSDFIFSEIIDKKLPYVTLKRPYSPLLNSLSYNRSVFNTPYKFWIKVQRADLTCDVIRKVPPFVLSKLWILVADWSMHCSRDTFLIKLRLFL